MDYNGNSNVSGGILIVSGTNSNMTQATSASSSQYCIKATTTQSIPASTIFHVQDASGDNLNGLYQGGVFFGGTQKKSFTVSRKVTSVSF